MMVRNNKAQDLEVLGSIRWLGYELAVTFGHGFETIPTALFCLSALRQPPLDWMTQAVASCNYCLGNSGKEEHERHSF